MPAGRYRVKAWHPRAGEQVKVVTVPVDSEVAVEFSLDVSSFKRVPHKNKFGKAYSEGERY